VLKHLLIALAALAWFSAAPAVASIHGGGTPFPPTCPQGLSISDGCLAAQATSYAQDIIGNPIAINGWPSDAQQSCATYGCAAPGQCLTTCQVWSNPGGSSTHPWIWNAAGIDYPVGSYTPMSGLQDPATATTSALAAPGLGIIPGNSLYSATGYVVSAAPNNGSYPWLEIGFSNTHPLLSGTTVQGFYLGPDTPSFHTIGAQTTGTSVITAGPPDTISLTLATTTPTGYIAASTTNPLINQNVYSGCAIHANAPPTGCTLIGTLNGQVSGTTGGTGVYYITGDTPGSYTGVTVAHDAVYVLGGSFCQTANSFLTITNNWLQMGSSLNQRAGNMVKTQGSSANGCGGYTWNFTYNTVLGGYPTYTTLGMQEAVEMAAAGMTYHIEYNYFRDHGGRIGDIGGTFTNAGTMYWRYNFVWGCCEYPVVLHGEDFISGVPNNVVEFNTDIIPNTSIYNTTTYFFGGYSPAVQLGSIQIDHNIDVINTGWIGAQNITGTLNGECPNTPPSGITDSCTLTVTSLTGTLLGGNVIAGGGLSSPVTLFPLGQIECNGATCTGLGTTGIYAVAASQTVASGSVSFTNANVVQGVGTSALLTEFGSMNVTTLNISYNFIDTAGGVGQNFNAACMNNLNGAAGGIAGSQTGTSVTITAIGSGALYAGPQWGSIAGAFAGNEIGGNGLTNEWLTAPPGGPYSSTSTFPLSFTASVSQTKTFTSSIAESGAVGTGGSFTMVGNQSLLTGNAISGFGIPAQSTGCN
jgi:hypothetical protein